MKLNAANYFSKEADTEYMSVSQYKSFRECEAKALAEIKREYIKPSTTALLQGSYIDAHFEGRLGDFATEHPEMFKRDGSLKSEFAMLDYVIKRVEDQPLMLKLLSGEKQKILTGEIEGIKVKVKVDSLCDDAVVDLKCMRDFKPIYKEGQGRLHWYQAWGYDTQGAVYREIVKQNTGKELPFILCAVTKEAEPDLACLRVSDEELDFELKEVKKHIVKYDAIKKGLIEPERCECCDYCRRTKTLTEIIETGEMFE